MAKEKDDEAQEADAKEASSGIGGTLDKIIEGLGELKSQLQEQGLIPESEEDEEDDEDIDLSEFVDEPDAEDPELGGKVKEFSKFLGKMKPNKNNVGTLEAIINGFNVCVGKNFKGQ